MTTYHVLNGDCLADQLRQTGINQNFIVCRECLVEGEVDAGSIAEFWVKRAKFIAGTYHASTEEYFSRTVSEFEKLETLPDGSEVCLWFENDLFCQVNMWFVLSILSNQPSLNIYRVFPVIENQANTWKGFGMSSAEQLVQAFAAKVPFRDEDIALGKKLWEAYQKSDFKKLKELSKETSDCFEFLEEVGQAHLDRFPLDGSLGRPERMVKQIVDTVSKDFQTVVSVFSDLEGVYGFGDLQIKSIYDKQT